MKKIFKYFFFSILLLLIVVLTYVAIYFPTVMGGMAAKTMCSCVYVSGRTPESIKAKELQVFPGLSSADFKFESDSSVTTKILWHTSTALYRKGLGCTLLAERSKEEIKKQKFRLAQLPAINQDTIPWPSGDKLDSLPDNISIELINRTVDSAFYEVDKDKPINTHAVVIVYDGKIIAEKYADGFDKHSKLMGWSMTKSISNALVGILVKQGKLKLEESAPVPEWRNDERKAITLNDLMHASSGLKWSESYFVPSSDFHNMFIRSDDKGGYAARSELKYKPGEFFEYSSGTTNILSRMIRQTVGDEEYYRFPFEQLFYKIGMYGAVMEPDASGTFVMSSYSYATARDWARFGLLYQQDGMWNGERILPEGWVKYSSTPAPAAKKQEYGAQWWLNAGDPSNPTNAKFPGLPSESIIADGFENQFVVIVPSKKLVVVRLGVTHNKNFKIAKLVNGVIQGLPD
jgi:CubicO group peptidase (beta-lactamase class C family)